MNQVDTDKVTLTDTYGHITGLTVPSVTLGQTGCGLHPKYRAVRKPTSKCRTCRAFYETRHR